MLRVEFGHPPLPSGRGIAALAKPLEADAALVLSHGRVASEVAEQVFLAGGVSVVHQVGRELLAAPALASTFDLSVLLPGPTGTLGPIPGAIRDVSLGEVLLALAFGADELDQLALEQLYEKASQLAFGVPFRRARVRAAPRALLRLAERRSASLSSSLLCALCRHVVEVEEYERPDDSALALAAGLAIEVLSRRSEHLEIAAGLLDLALARLDLPHLLDASPSLSIHLYAAIDMRALPAGQLIPEFGAPDDFVDRFDLRDLARVSSQLPGDLLSIARRNRLHDWAWRRGAPQAFRLDADVLRWISGTNMAFLLVSAQAFSNPDADYDHGDLTRLHQRWVESVGRAPESLYETLGLIHRDLDPQEDLLEKLSTLR